jgi:hypothetical protein
MATTKLTLSMEPEVVYQAKRLAKDKNISLSKLVENYLRSISKEGKAASEGLEISDWVKGMVAVDKPTPDFDHKAEYHKHLEEKYGR